MSNFIIIIIMRRIKLIALVIMTGLLTSCSAFNEENLSDTIMYLMIAIVVVVIIVGYIGEGSDDY